MQNETLATEVIKEAQEKLNKVVTELDNLDPDFDKALFALSEIGESLDLKYPETKEAVCYLHMAQERIDMLAGIALDYISQIKTCVTDIVIRERRAANDKQ